jgi:hypothetical protein
MEKYRKRQLASGLPYRSGRASMVCRRAGSSNPVREYPLLSAAPRGYPKGRGS